MECLRWLVRRDDEHTDVFELPFDLFGHELPLPIVFREVVSNARTPRAQAFIRELIGWCSDDVNTSTALLLREEEDFEDAQVRAVHKELVLLLAKRWIFPRRTHTPPRRAAFRSELTPFCGEFVGFKRKKACEECDE